MSEPNKYLRKITTDADGCVDVYAVLLAFGVTCPATQHAVKKLLCAGQRGSKSRGQDLAEACVAMERACALHNEDCQ